VLENVREADIVFAVLLYRLQLTLVTEVPAVHDGEVGPVTSEGKANTKTSPE
jgi:hypothetical protein